MSGSGGMGPEFCLPPNRAGFQQPFPITSGRISVIPALAARTAVFQASGFPVAGQTWDLAIQVTAPNRLDPSDPVPVAALKDTDPGFMWFDYMHFLLEWSCGAVPAGAAWAELDFNSASICLPLMADSIALSVISTAPVPAVPSAKAMQVAVMMGESRGARPAALARRTVQYGLVIHNSFVVRAVPRGGTRATVKLFDNPGADKVWADEFDFAGTQVGGFSVWPTVTPGPIELSNACQFLRLRNGNGNADVIAAVTYDLSL